MTAIRTRAYVGRGAARRLLAGRMCFWGGIVGLVQAIVVLAWPSPVGTNRYSSPFHPTGFTIAQLTFCLQHIALAAGLWAVLQVPAIRTKRISRIGAITALTGMVLLAAQELVAISAAHLSANSSPATVIDSLYTVPIFLTAIGCLVTGLSTRSRPSRSALGWLPTLLVVIGVYAFVPLTPAIAGPEALGRIAIGGWMLLFAALGWTLTNPRNASQNETRTGAP